MMKFTQSNAIEGDMESINYLIKKIHENAISHGWWEEERSRDEIFALIHSELSEALEEYRNSKPMIYYMDGKPEGIAVELADAVIRILDYIGRKQDDNHFHYHYNYQHYKVNILEKDSLPELVVCCHRYITEAYIAEVVEWMMFEKCIYNIQKWLESNGINLEKIIKIKHEYNKTRPYRHGGKII